MDPAFQIDGRPVRVSDWQMDASANWGPRSFSAQVPRSVTWAEQEAPLTAHIGDQLMWVGKLIQDPRTEAGIKHVRAEGNAADISAQNVRLMYRIDGTQDWVDLDSDPHGYAATEKIDLETGPSALFAALGDGNTAFQLGDSAGWVLWTEGADITGYSVLAFISGGATFDLRTQRATGPSGTRTVVNDHVLTQTPTTRTATGISPAEDMLTFLIRCNQAVTPGARRRVKLSEIKVYGRTAVDAFTASDVVTDVGSNAGIGTDGVRANGLEILPLDWREDHTSLLDYMAELTDWRWMVYGDDLEFAPWEQTWTTFLAADATADLEPQRRYNRVTVPYESVSGTHRSVTVAPEVDPFPTSAVVFTADELEEPQRNANLATAVATTLMEYYSSRRLAGQVRPGRVRDEMGHPHSPYLVRPGTLLEMPDSGYGPQRIQAVSYGPDEQVSLNLNDDFNVVRLLADLRSDRKWTRRRKKRREK